MQITVRNDSVEIEGYVNAVERRSKPIKTRGGGNFIERICKGAFKKALVRNPNVRLLLNHNWSRDLGGTEDGNLELTEDNIGLRAKAKITDPETVEKAKRGDLVGWSFGFQDRDVDNHEENGMPTRDIKDLDLYEVSLLDRTRTPAYEGTLVSVRSDEIHFHGEAMIDDVEIRAVETTNEPKRETAEDKPIDYTKYEKIIQEMKEAK